MGRDLVEMAHELDHPDQREDAEDHHDVEHGDGVEAVVCIEIGVNGERGAVEEDEENGTAKPSHLRAEKAEGYLAMFGSEPVGFVGEIDAIRRFRREEDGRDESNDGGDADNEEHENEKELLGLKAVGSAVGGEMGGHDRGKLRIGAGPLQKAEREQKKVDEFGKSRIVHVVVEFRVRQTDRPSNGDRGECAQEVLAFTERIAEIGRNPSQADDKM